ncbi:MAG: class I SAM-dependent methyltransferase [Firmicutes bacterium]|nr:class I SAM-dependent methyltransferase [Bacillota bacterium]
MKILYDVEETMLIPLAIKANETMKKKARIQDKKAVEIIQKLQIDTQKYDKFMSHEGVVARTILIDKALKSILCQIPDAVCICIGCGLDARFERVDNGKITWYDLDLPNVIKCRKEYFVKQQRVHMIAKSALDASWTENIIKNKTTIFIIEGLLMYFNEKQVKELLNIICSHFKKSILLLEVSSPFLCKMSKYHDTVKNTDAVFQWGISSGKELESYVSGLKLVSDTSFNEEMKKYSFRGRLFATLPFIKNMNDRLVICKYKQ